MSSCEIFKFDLSLEQLAGIAVAISFWERPDVKKSIHNYDGSDHCYDPNNTSHDVSTCQKIINYIYEQLDLLQFPRKLLDEIKTLVVKIGRKISMWRKYVTEVLKLKLKYAKKIYWTCYGDIDELKILQGFWLKRQQLRGLSNHSCCFMNCKLFCIATRFADENYVSENIEMFKQEIFSHINLEEQKEKWRPYSVIATWILFCTNVEEKTALQCMRSFNYKPLSAKGLFQICVDNNLEFAAKYFWNKIKLKEKQRLALKTAKRLISNYFNLIFELKIFELKIFDWIVEKNLKMILFLINEMMEVEKIEFIMENNIILFKLCLEIWPYQDLCPKFLNLVLHQVPGDHYKLLHILVYCLISNKVAYFTCRKSLNEIFEILMKKIQGKVKKKFFTEKNFQHVKYLYQASAFKSLSLVINDPDLKEIRENFLDINLNKFKGSMLNGDFKHVNDFIENMKFGEDELKSFKQKLNFLDSFLISGKLDLAEQHLNWLADTDEKKKEIINEINAVDICFTILQNNKFDIADKFLQWRFNREEEREQVKEILKSNGFVENKIFEIWRSKRRSTFLTLIAENSVLDWFYKSEEEIIKFKKKITEDQVNLVEKYWDFLFYDKNFKHFNDFLKFCLFTSDEINSMKASIAGKINWWIDTFALEKNKFQMIDKLMDWVYPEDGNKKKAVTSYMSSIRGSLLCMKVFRNYKKLDLKDLGHFYNFWIDESLYIPELVQQLRECDSVEPDVIDCMTRLLNKRAKGKLIPRSDFFKHLKSKSYLSESDDYYSDDSEETFDYDFNTGSEEETSDYSSSEEETLDDSSSEEETSDSDSISDSDSNSNESDLE